MPISVRETAAVFFADFVIFRVQLAATWAILAYHSTILAGSRAGDDQRGAGFIDQDVIHFIDDGKMMATLHAIIPAHGDVIPQVIKTELAVGTVGDIGLVGLPAMAGACLRFLL